MKWEDKLLGHKFTLVTDHKGLKYFETQKNLSDRQVWWWEFLSHFNYTIMHIDGIDNKVSDCLSLLRKWSEWGQSLGKHLCQCGHKARPRWKTAANWLLHGTARSSNQAVKATRWMTRISSYRGRDSKCWWQTVTAITAGNDGNSLQTHVEEMMDLRAVIKNALLKIYLNI